MSKNSVKCNYLITLIICSIVLITNRLLSLTSAPTETIVFDMLKCLYGVTLINPQKLPLSLETFMSDCMYVYRENENNRLITNCM